MPNKILREIGRREQKFCFECARFPRARNRQLDPRYRTKYGMSTIENLESIRGLGLEGFVTREKVRWKCPECGECCACIERAVSSAVEPGVRARPPNNTACSRIASASLQ
jgi:hypothetical protein